MAAIQDLLQQITDPMLRERLTEEVNRVSKNRKFGLVFEEHVPECTPLYGVPIRCDSTVARKTGKLNPIYIVKKIDGKTAVCEDKVSSEITTIPLCDLVAVAQFGDPIFPSLEPIAKVENAPNDSLWHTIIEADNYHALQLLEYLYEGQVDCIYIDPPYNTGARDWKYNNDYVDSNDAYRHSKWLSMMKKRLLIAKRLLKETGILIITIDDNELSHLDCILMSMFPEYDRFIVTIEHSRRGRRGKNMAKSNEFGLFLVRHGLDIICQETAIGLGGEVRNLRRTGSGSLRTQRHKKFYPIYIDTIKQCVVEIGEYLPLDRPASLTPAAKKQIVALIGKDKLPQSLVKADSRFIVSEKHTASVLFDPDAADEWLNALEDREHITDFYIVPKDSRTYNNIRQKVVDLLGTVTVTEPLKRPMSEGFAANAEYFKLGFLDKNSVSLGQQFAEILPLLWLKAGAIGKRPELDSAELPNMLILPQNSFAVLLDEDCYGKFAEALLETKNIGTVYFVTNSGEAFREMSDGIGIEQTYQLYRDYIDNFVIGSRRNNL